MKIGQIIKDIDYQGTKDKVYKRKRRDEKSKIRESSIISETKGVESLRKALGESKALRQESIAKRMAGLQSGKLAGESG